MLFSHGYCHSCWKRNYKPPRPIKKSTGKPVSDRSYNKIAKVSKKAYERNLMYKKARVDYLESHPVCEVKLPDCLIPTIDCDNSGLQVHHRRGRIGDLMWDKRYFLAVCHNCHRYLEDHPEQAKANGWSLSRLSKEEPKTEDMKDNKEIQEG